MQLNKEKKYEKMNEIWDTSPLVWGCIFFFVQKQNRKSHKTRKTEGFAEMCKFCDKIKKFKKGLEKGEKVVYN